MPRQTLKVRRDNGLRLLLVGYEPGNQQILHNIKKGHAGRGGAALHQGLPRARDHDPRHVHPRPARRDPGDDRGDDLVRRGDEHGVQIAPLHDPHLGHSEIFHSVEDFYRPFYFRAPEIAAIVGEMVKSPQMMRRRLREGVEFFRFLRERKAAA